MINLPKWVQRILDESVCPSCKMKADKNGVFAEGIREDIHPKTKQPYLSFFFLYICHKCKKLGTFSGLPTNFPDFIGDMIEVSNSPTPTTSNILNERNFESGGTPNIDEESGISQQEIKDFKKMLKSTKYFEDFLGNIGIDRGDFKSKDDDK